MFPAAKLRALPAIIPGSRHTQFTERHEGAPRAGEITTVDRGGVVTFLVLNAPGDVYPKLRDEYASFVRSWSPLSREASPAATTTTPTPTTTTATTTAPATARPASAPTPRTSAPGATPAAGGSTETHP